MDILKNKVLVALGLGVPFTGGDFEVKIEDSVRTVVFKGTEVATFKVVGDSLADVKFIIEEDLLDFYNQILDLPKIYTLQSLFLLKESGQIKLKFSSALGVRKVNLFACGTTKVKDRELILAEDKFNGC